MLVHAIFDKIENFCLEAFRKNSCFIFERCWCTMVFYKCALSAAKHFDRVMCNVQCLEHLKFAHFVHFAFHHYDGVFFTGDNEVEITFFKIANGRVDHKFSIQAADAHTGGWTFEGSAGTKQCGRSSYTRQYVSIVVLIC